MKWRIYIAVIWCMMVLSSCSPPTQVVEPAEGPSEELSAIDSLMWRQPDIALAQLQRFVVSPEADSLDEFNGHYCQLLISELLYKNDWGQSNREELLQAVAYFDSLVREAPHPPLKGGAQRAGDSKKISNLTPNLVFLAARAHYINGAGYYEKDSVVNACAEYLKALEVMEEHFEEKERVGNMAKFMALTHGRLGEMFEEQLLAEPAIACYKQALSYCRREPTSKYGIPVLLYHLGIQYDIVDQKDSAAFYYDEALANMPDFDNLHYRDLMSNKAIFAFYNLDYSSDSVINILKHLVTLSADEEERTTRLLTLGHILFEDKQYDSSRVYLETVFEQQEDITSKMIAAERLSSIYQMEGDSIKAQKYASFLVGLTMSEIEKKTEASKENEMFKDYLAQKQKKQAVIEREKAVKRALLIIIPIAAVVALVVFIDAKRRNKKQLKEQQAEAKKLLEEKDKRHAEVLEAERQTHRMEQAAIAGRLKRSNQELRELKGQIKHLDDLAAKTEVAASFDEEPICRLIMERVNEGQFKAKIDCELYKSYALDKQQLLDLRVAADLHFSQLTLRLRKTYPKLTNIDIDYCCLYLLNLTHADVSALMQRAYNTVVERDSKIQKILGSEKPLPVILMDIAHNPSST